MEAGEWYSCIDPELDALRHAARIAVHDHNTAHPDRRGALGARLASLLGTVGDGVFVEAPLHVAYGFNLHLGDGVYVNAGCAILDTARVEIGSGTMLGPAVQIYCPEHHTDPARRAEGLELARPVTIGRNVWIGGAAVILGGIAIGDNAIVGAGSVVTRDVAAGAVVVGNPARQRS